MPWPARMMPLKPRWRRSRIGIDRRRAAGGDEDRVGLGRDELERLRRRAGGGAFERFDGDHLHAGRRQQLVEQAGPDLQIGVVEAHDADGLDAVVGKILDHRWRGGVVVGHDLERPAADLIDRIGQRLDRAGGKQRRLGFAGNRHHGERRRRHRLADQHVGLVFGDQLAGVCRGLRHVGAAVEHDVVDLEPADRRRHQAHRVHHRHAER